MIGVSRPALLRSNSLVVGVLAALAGCGPSTLSLQESSVRFEHCYRLDLEPEAVRSHRLRCWQSWLSDHREGESRDRVQYALERQERLQAGESAAIALRLDVAEGGCNPATPTATCNSAAPAASAASSGAPNTSPSSVPSQPVRHAEHAAATLEHPAPSQVLASSGQRVGAPTRR